MSPKTDLLAARAEMVSVLDAKLPNMPEWRALKAIDRALAAMSGETSAAPLPVKGEPRRTLRLLPRPYVPLAVEAIDQAGRPLTTPEIMEAIAKSRDLGPDLAKARINVQSALSKDSRVDSIAWRGGRAWWKAGKPPPKTEPEGLALMP